MFSALNLSRLSAFAGALGSALVIFVSNAAPNGKYTAAGVFAGLVAVWVHEEHSTERTSTVAAASLKPAPPALAAPTVAMPSVHELVAQATRALAGDVAPGSPAAFIPPAAAAAPPAAPPA